MRFFSIRLNLLRKDGLYYEKTDFNFSFGFCPRALLRCERTVFIVKKLILILTLIFALVLCFVACEDLGDNSKEGQSINALSGGTPETEEPTTEGRTFTELSTDDEKGRELRAELVKLLELKDGFVTPVIGSFEEKINGVLYHGKKATHVQFDPSKYYYVCGYYNCEHADENKWYNCAGKYTWIIVNNETDIPEYYNGLKFIAAFQINQAAYAIDIATGEAVSTEVEHYLEYTPEFVNSKNVAEKRYFDGTYICFTDPEDEYMFDCSEDYFHSTYTLSCLEKDGEWYLKFFDNGVENNFGEYCDLLTPISKEYTMVNELGNSVTYIIIKFSDFANTIFNNY